MTITLSVQEALIGILIIAAIILVIYLIVILSKLKPTLEKLDRVLDEVEVITGTTANKVEQVDEIIAGVGDSVSTVVGALKGNQSLLLGATNFLNAAASLCGVVKKPSIRKEKKEK